MPGGGECIYGGRKAKLKLTIRPVNDRPVLNVKNLIAQFPPVPENVSDIDGKNIKVSTFTKSSQGLIDKYIRENKGDELFNKMEAGEVLADRNNPLKYYVPGIHIRSCLVIPEDQKKKAGTRCCLIQGKM